ncbi:MAG: FAD-dependent monooxygenase [Bradyrhizobium sp.]
MPNKNKKVLIAGGGIGGITALLALRQRGIAAELFEQAAAFSQVGAGLQVSGNATRILRKLGLGDALAKVAYYPEARDYRAWDNGDRLYYTPLGERAEARFGAPYYTAHRPTCWMCCSAVLKREVSVSAAVSSASIRMTTASLFRSRMAAPRPATS